MSRTYTVTFGPSGLTKEWTDKREMSEDMLLTTLCQRAERNKKDGTCLVPGALASTRRLKHSVVSIDLLIYDIDGAQTIDEVDKKLTELGYKALLFSTYSHKSTKSEVAPAHIQKWLKDQQRVGEEITLDVMKEYLASNKKGYLKDVVFDVANTDVHFPVTDEGPTYVVHHAPLDKLRVVFFLEKPIVLRKLGATNDLVDAAYKSIYIGIGQALGLDFDYACKDMNRLYYTAASKPGNERVMAIYPKHKFDEASNLMAFDGGTYLPWDKFPRATLKNERARRGNPEKILASDFIVPDKDGRPINLYHWFQQNATEFDIEGLLERVLDEDMIRASRSPTGFHIECPYEHEHTRPGGQGTFCANGDGDHSFTIFCSHNACSDRRSLDFLKRMVLDGRIVASDLGIQIVEVAPPTDKNAALVELGIDPSTLPTFSDEDVDYSGDDSPVNVRLVSVEDSAERTAHLQQVIIDAAGGNHVREAMYHLVSINGSLDAATLIDLLAKNRFVGFSALKPIFKAFNQHIIDGDSGVPIDWTTFEQGLVEQRSEQQDTLQNAISRIVTMAYVGLQRDRELKRLADYYCVPHKDVILTCKGLEDAHRAQVIDEDMRTHMLKYTAKYAMIDSGAKTLYLDMEESRATSDVKIYQSDALNTQFRASNIEIITNNKKKPTEKINTFKYWQDNETAVLHFKGVTFDPNEPEFTSDNKWNIWNAKKPWGVIPKKGDASPVLDHIRNVWCNNDMTVYHWVMMFLADIFQNPGNKPHCAIVLIGGQGTGKSIVVEKGLSRLLGKMYGASADREAITGKFNKQLGTALLWMAEEALFAGDKQSMNKLKDRISRETIDLEPKYMDKIMVPNFTRYIFSSNQDHALHLEHGDRRFLILRTTDQYKQNVEYFTNLKLWFAGDGASYMLHYLLNFKPETYGLSWHDLYNVPMTEAKQSQIALGRDPSEDFFIDILRHGRIPNLGPGDLDGNLEWGLETELAIHPERFRALFDSYLKHFMGSSYRYERQRWGLMFKRFFGGTPTEFSKVRRVGVGTDASGKSAKIIVMPPRKEIALRAFSSGILPEDDYKFSLDNPNSHRPIFEDL